MADQITAEQLVENALAPKTVTADGTTATQHDLREQIEADRYAASKRAVASSKRGFLLGKFRPPGAF